MSEPQLCACADTPDAAVIWEPRNVPFIPRWGWSGIDYHCRGCDGLRADSWSLLTSPPVWSDGPVET